MIEENFEGFAGHTAEQQNNLTDEQALKALYENQDLVNLIMAYRDGLIDSKGLNRIVSQMINKDEAHNGN